MYWVFKSRSGTYTAEAALVLPFVIISLITVVLILLFFYDSSVSESRMHMALRCKAGIVTDKVTAYAEDGSILSPEDIWDGSITSSGFSAAKYLRGNKDISMISDGLLARLGKRQLTDELKAVDPVRALRLRQIVQSEQEAG